MIHNPYIAVFTWMQDDSDLSWPTQIKHAYLGKMCLFKSKMPSKNKMSAKKKYFNINFIHFIHKACHIPSACTNQCHFLFVHSQNFHLPHTNFYHPHPLHCHSTSSSSSILSTTLDMQHFLKIPSQSLLVKCAAIPVWYTLTK